MTDATFHLGAEELDLWLEDRLPASRMSHLETCEQCRTAAEETREVVLQLARLPKVAPAVSFADRVMARIDLPAAAGHLSLDELDLWVTAQLPPGREGHLRNCQGCQKLANEERMLVMRLEALPLFNPREGFSDRVMDRVHVPVISLAGAWRLWRTGFTRNPMHVGIAASVAVLLGGSVAASAAWAAGHQDLITGAGTWLLSYGEQWYWQGVSLATGFLERQAWYDSARAALTPARLIGIGAMAVGLYTGGVLLLRRLLALPDSPVARATH
jgi:hypothetical protein